MTDVQSLRQQLVSEIEQLPQEALVEVLAFVNYQHYKLSRQVETQNAQPSPIQKIDVEAIAALLSEVPLSERLSPEALAQAFLEWAESHRDLHLPILSDQAISRESIYGERG